MARVQAVDERTVIRQLSSVLQKQHRLVRALESHRLGDQRLSRYRFHHILFQQYLYHHLDEIERGYLHEAVGAGLEASYGEQTEPVAVQLARHFEIAGLTNKAVAYLRQAGGQARRLSTYREAIVYFSRAPELLGGGHCPLPASGSCAGLFLRRHRCKATLSRFWGAAHVLARLSRSGLQNIDVSPV